MPLDAAKNFAKATLSAGYDAVATSVSVTSGGGARFPAPPFNATWFNDTDYFDPSDDPNVEIVRVTNIVGDTLTVTRAQEGTSAYAHNLAGKTYKLVAGPTAKLVTDIAASLPAVGCRIITAAASIGANDTVVLIDPPGVSVFDVTLPDLTLCVGKVFFIVGRRLSGGLATVVTYGAQKIAQNTFEYSHAGFNSDTTPLILFSDGTRWQMLNYQGNTASLS